MGYIVQRTSGSSSTPFNLQGDALRSAPCRFLSAVLSTSSMTCRGVDGKSATISSVTRFSVNIDNLLGNLDTFQFAGSSNSGLTSISYSNLKSPSCRQFNVFQVSSCGSPSISKSCSSSICSKAFSQKTQLRSGQRSSSPKRFSISRRGALGPYRKPGNTAEFRSSWYCSSSCLSISARGMVNRDLSSSMTPLSSIINLKLHFGFIPDFQSRPDLTASSSF